MDGLPVGLPRSVVSGESLRVRNTNSLDRASSAGKPKIDENEASKQQEQLKH